MTSETKRPLGSRDRRVRSKEATIYGERVIQPGDTVELLPVDKCTYETEEDQYWAQREFEENRRWLGNGPFTVSSITKWPCGRVMLYLKGALTDEPGAYASDFM